MTNIKKTNFKDYIFQLSLLGTDQKVVLVRSRLPGRLHIRHVNALL